MSLELQPAAPGLRFSWRLLAAWSLTWMTGIGILAGLAIYLEGTSRVADLDTELSLYATATYGLTWFDADGALQDTLLRREPTLADPPVDIWVVTPGTPPVIHLAPPRPRFTIASFDALREPVMGRAEEVFRDGVDERGARYRLLAVPAFNDRDDSLPVAIIAVVGDPALGRAGHRAFAASVVALSVTLGMVGLAIGFGLTRLSMRPALAQLRQRERFLAAAAHEFRTPLAAMRSIAESALAGDEDPATALRRLAPIIDQATGTVDNLLLLARFESDSIRLRREPVRLDLLVDATLPEDAPIALHAGPITADLDVHLTRVAVRNLIDNALLHGSPSGEEITVTVTPGVVTIEDLGPGFSATVLEHIAHGRSVAPAPGGNGLGLAIAQLVAHLHGGELRLTNHGEGARATLNLGTFDPRSVAFDMDTNTLQHGHVV